MAKAKGKQSEEKSEKKKGKVQQKQKQLPTRKQLDDAPSAVTLTVDGQGLSATKKEFSSGSVGWNGNGKVVIGGLTCQVSCNIVIVGSKDTK